MTDAKLGRMIWEVLHAVAVNFPDGAAKGLTKQRLQGYYDFFKSLEHVLPRPEWRSMWRNVTATGITQLDKSRFDALRSHQELSNWMYYLHDAVRKKLNQRIMHPGYAEWYKKYKVYRSNIAGANNAPVNARGVAAIQVMLMKHNSAMDEFLLSRYGPEYAGWSRVEKAKARVAHTREAARWFWKQTGNRLSSGEGWNATSADAKRNAIVRQFGRTYRRFRTKVSNAVSGLQYLLPSLS